MIAAGRISEDQRNGLLRCKRCANNGTAQTFRAAGATRERSRAREKTKNTALWKFHGTISVPFGDLLV
jgi:hypothetical protein